MPISFIRLNSYEMSQSLIVQGLRDLAASCTLMFQYELSRKNVAGISPQKEPCNKIYGKHKTPGIPIWIPGVLCSIHGNMLSRSLRVNPVAAATCSRGISIDRRFFAIVNALWRLPLSSAVAKSDCRSVWNFLRLR